MNNTVKLEVDPSIIERNLDFRVKTLQSDEDEDPLSRLFPKSSPSPNEIPYKTVTPKPGFVIKLRTVEGDKIFINICHCAEVPAPKDISEQELIELLDSEDPSSYTVPMSIGDLHVESDKSGNLASAYDIAINTEFLNKIDSNLLFKNFFISVVSEGIEDKYKLQLDRETEVVTLKNRKCFGKLQSHRIQQRPVRSGPQKQIEELPDSPNNIPQNKSQKKPLIEVLPDTSGADDMEVENSTQEKNKNSSTTLEDLQLPLSKMNNVRLIRTPKDGPVERLVAFIQISALTGKELELDVGEDRILVRSTRKNEMIDFFLPYNVNRDKVMAKYFVNTQSLRVDLPVKE
uniref:PIH1 domain-containing protein 1 n=1 Tax=Panstrongylus megistus TaxID=65343 RepID=A0A069DYP7_9HEMI